MQRLRYWDKARAERPSIFVPEKKPLIRSYLDNKHQFDKARLRQFAAKLLETAKPRDPLDIPEINRCIAKSFESCSINDSFLEVSIASRHQFMARSAYANVLVASLLIAYDVFSHCGLDENKVLDAAVETVSSLIKDDDLPFQRVRGKRTFTSGNWLNALYNSKDCHEALSGHSNPRELFAKLYNRYCEVSQRFDFQSDVGFSEAAVLHLQQHVREMFSFESPIMYPYFRLRLIAAMTENSFVSGKDFDDDRKYRESSLTIREGSMALIAMFPWEADHLEKAKEMAARGIPVAKPVGRMFVDDFEIALFKWVEGKSLMHLLDRGLYERYGALVRECHDKGIMLMDPAPRNVNWTGRRLVLFDFEHVFFTEQARPLTKEQREKSLESMEWELTDGLHDAFLRGYKSGSGKN
ncbi:MAG: hypothetical protein V1492_02035 [Candidatus Micrarchaeota archaeon]